MDTILSNQTLYYRNNSRKRTALHVTDLNFPIPNGVRLRENIFRCGLKTSMHSKRFRGHGVWEQKND